MTKQRIQKLNNIFKSIPEIKLVYLFGSQAKGKTGPLSDYDFAVFLDINPNNKNKIYNIKFNLQDRISREVKNNNVDVVILNIAASPELKYNIITKGKLIYDVKPYKTIVEPKILNEYFDYYYLMRKYNLTGVKHE